MGLQTLDSVNSSGTPGTIGSTRETQVEWLQTLIVMRLFNLSVFVLGEILLGSNEKDEINL